ncbi:hypothetical protein RSAG8_10358, partial [Rhizoctonia solani AG-8 WAC10335]
ISLPNVSRFPGSYGIARYHPCNFGGWFRVTSLCCVTIVLAPHGRNEQTPRNAVHAS